MARRILLVLIVAALVPTLVAAQQRGFFHYGDVRFVPTDIVAWQAEASGEEPAHTVVAFTDFTVDRKQLVAAIDTVTDLQMQVYARESGNFVIARLLAPDRCGIVAYLTSGERPQQISLSSDFPATFKTVSSRVAGSCRTDGKRNFGEDKYEFRLPFDVAITAIPKPQPLPKDGGEPGRALVALSKAIEKKDFAVARRHLHLDEMPRNGAAPSDMKLYFEGLALNHPKSVKTTGGLIKGDRAQVEVKGVSAEGSNLRGIYLMEKRDGAWRITAKSLYHE
jgi:hypothetical protein